MKKIFTLMLLAAAACGTASAQYLPNAGFDNWKGSGNAGSTYQSSRSGLSGSTNAGMRQRPGDEPTEWFGGSINQKVMGLEKKQELLYKVTDKDNTWVKMTNTFVGVANIGSVAPGFLNFGTPWVYAVSDISKCDGGTYGGRSFSYKPDAVVGRFKKTPVATAENSYIIAYLWSGTFTSQIASTSTKDADRLRDDVDRAILGSVSKTGVTAPSNVTNKGKLIAWCNHGYKTTKNNDWETIEVPLNYEDVNAVPEKMNVIVSSGDYYTRGNLQDGTVVEVDDLDFVYWNTLSSLKYDGAELLEGEETAYDMSSVAYDPAKLVATAKSQFGTASVSYDDATCVATITVTREHAVAKTYTVQFGSAKAKATMNVSAAAGWGTFCAPFAVTAPSGVTVSTIRSIGDNGQLTLLRVSNGAIPANTPVILKSTIDVSTTFEGAAEEGTPVKNYLTGVYTETIAPEGSYVLQNQNSGVGFYLVEPGTLVTVQPNRCYLTLPAGSSARALFFDEDDLVTALNGAIITDEPEAAYDLQGRRVNVAGQKGMLIIGGRKVIK